MARERNPVIERDGKIRSFLIGLIVLVTFIIVLLSDRPIGFTNRPWVEPVAPIPARAGLGEIEQFLNYNVTIMPKAEHRPFAVLFAPPTASGGGAAAEQAGPLMLGYSIRELDALGMPFVAYPEAGYVAYRERGGSFELVPLDDDYRALLAKRAGSRLEAGYVFPFWRYFWGWLWLLGLAGIGLFELGALRRRRSALGLI